MNTIQRSLNILMIAGLAIALKADITSFDNVSTSMHKDIEKMQKEMEKMFDAIPAGDTKLIGFKQSNPVITENNDKVLISMELPDVDADKINVKKLTDMQGEYILVEIPYQENYKTEIVITNKMVHSTTMRETEHQATQDDTKDASYAFGASKFLQTLPVEILLQDIQPEYNKDKKTLTISLQKAHPTSSQIIPIVKK